MNCLLTGVTGIVGSHILFEWLKKSLIDKSVDTIYTVIRETSISSKERLLQILNDTARPEFMNRFTIEECLSKIKIVSSDVSLLTKERLSVLNCDTVLHCAGNTNLQHTNITAEEVKKQNYNVTLYLLENLPKTVNRFLYVSTAFSFGIQDEKVSDHIENHKVTSFRNPYEGSKYASEKLVKEYCASKSIHTQILRPSIVCGRLLDAPFFTTPKFDVFYSWPLFLHRYAKKCTDSFRIWIDKTSGLNIVPVDFVAKTILYAYLNPELKEVNIVNPKPILHKEYLSKVLRSFGIENFEYVSEKPIDLNLFEELYYKTVGQVFEKYVSIPDLKYEATQIKKLIKEFNLDISLGVHQNFMNLIDHSIKKGFKKSYI